MWGTESMLGIDLIAAIVFAIALRHSFSAKAFERMAHRSWRPAELLHLLGEIEVVFGFWAIPFIAIMALMLGPAQALEYTEPLFVFVIMVETSRSAPSSVAGGGPAHRGSVSHVLVVGHHRTMAGRISVWVLGLALSCGAALAAPAVVCPPPLPTSAATGAPKDRGLLWRITREGRSSWLYGTLHVGKPEWRRFGPQVAAALKGSDELALEVDPSDPALMTALADTGPAPELPPALQLRLAHAYERACVASESLASLHPVLQATTLTVLEARWLGMDPAYAQEQLLVAHGRAARQRVFALETASQQKAALVPPDAAEALATLEQNLAQLEDQSGRRVLARMAQVWEQGNLTALEHYEQWCECANTDDERAFMRRLNDERNPALADGIEARHGQGRRVFAAVGALHMTGPQALPLLLAQRGFKVERVAFVP